MKKFKNSFLKTVSKVLAVALSLVVFASVVEWNFPVSGDGNAVAYADGSAVKSARAAEFVPLDYTITLDYQGGERADGENKITSDSLKVTSNNKTRVNVPEREGYAFYGFFSGKNASGVRYFDDEGEMDQNATFTVDTPRTLYAAWVKLCGGKTRIHDNIIELVNTDIKSTAYKQVGLDIPRLKELRYSQIRVDMCFVLYSLLKGDGMDIALQIGNRTVWERKDIYLPSTEWKRQFFSVTLNISDFYNGSGFSFLLKTHKLNRWTFGASDIIFTAVNQTPKNPQTTDLKYLNTASHVFTDGNCGYNISEADAGAAHPLYDNYVNFYLRNSGGKLINYGNNYGYISDDNSDVNANPEIEILLKYNFPQTEKINGTVWSVGYSDYSDSINGIHGAGKLGSGALLVSKSEDGKNYTWENSFSKDTVESFHSSDFVNNYSPSVYNGNPSTRKQTRPVVKRDSGGNAVYTYDSAGKKTGYEYEKDGENYIYAEEYTPSDGYLPIYRPSGADLKKGIYIKVLFAYQLSYYTYNSGWDEFWDGFINETKVWHYIDVVEETSLYICNGNAKILFQNMNFTSGEETSADNGATGELVRSFGTVNDGDAVNDGFKVNYNGNNYDVRYSKNDSILNDTVNDPVYDGRVFMEPGKYKFIVTPKVGSPRYTTIFINDRGAAQNLENYFGGNLIEDGSMRMFSQTSEVPVYKAGKVTWHVNAVDKTRMPVAGNIGRYKETLSEAEFAKKYAHPDDKSAMRSFREKYFRQPSKIEVDSDYKIIPDDGFTSYRVQVENGYTPKDGDGYEAYDAPQVVDGVTYVGTIYGSVTLDDGRVIVGTIDGYDVYEIVARKAADRKAESSNKLTESGEYVAEFANNARYFDDGVQVSGDVYIFLFRFTLTDEDYLPSVNKTFLNSNLSINDYESKFYGVKIPNTATGKTVTFVYYDSAAAHGAAYEYSRSLVTQTGSGYNFRGRNFADRSAVQSAVNAYAKELVSEDYFDYADIGSYLMYGGDPAAVLTSETVTKDVYVFDSSAAGYEYACGVNFLNDRSYSYLDENGAVKTAVNGVRFIQVADYESQSVELIHDETGTSYGKIPYGANVQGYLTGKYAPSGRYRIVEKNACGETQYYGIYLRAGDNRTSLKVTRVYNSLSETREITAETANAVFTANSFLLRSAENGLDPYGIVKITGKSGSARVYSLGEIENIKIDEAGEWTVSVIDRLGNTFNFYVNIYTPAKIHELTFSDDGNATKEFVTEGEKFSLPAPALDDGKFVFKGWQAPDGKIYNGTLKIGFTEDTTLTALYHYKSSTVEVYDGGLIKSYSTKPEETLILPDGLSRGGLEFYGYKYYNGEDRFCIGQLNSVPNVENLRLDAVYMDKNVSVTVKNGQSLDAPERLGYTFYGWGTSSRGASAYIFTDGVAEFSGRDTLTLYAMYVADSDNAPSHGMTAAGLIGGLGKFMTSHGGALVAAFAALVVLSLFVKRKNTREAAPASSGAVSVGRTCVSAAGAYKSKRRINAKTVVMTAVSILLAAVMTFYAVDRLLNGAGNAIRYNAFADTLAASYEQAAAVTDEDEEASDPEETFVYSTVALDLNTQGYDTFEAVLTKSDGEKVRGLGYTDWTYISQTDGVEHYKAGFISYSGEPFYGASDYGTAKISEYIEESDPEEWGLKYAFELKLKEEVWADHYIAFGRYVTYAVDGYRITYISAENTPENYITELGYLYDYDKNEVVYDPDLGAKFEKSGYTLASCPDYEKLIETYRSLINYQDQNGVTVDSVTFTVLDVSAIKEYVLHGQDETFLGISAEQIAFVESQVNNTQYYYVDGVTGQLSVLDASDVIVDDSATIWKILDIVLSGLMILAGAVLCVTAFFTGGVTLMPGLGMLSGGLIGLLMSVKQDWISATLVKYAGEKGAQGIGGVLTLGGAGVTIAIGSKLVSSFPGILTKVFGAVFVLMGICQMTFGITELTDATLNLNMFTDFMKMSDSLYQNLFRAVNYAAAAATVICAVVGTVYNTVKYGFAVKELGYKNIREYKRALESIKGNQSLVDDIVEFNSFIDENNETWKVVESRRNFKSEGPGLTREELLKLGGNGYIVNRKDPSKWVRITNGVIRMDKHILHPDAFLEIKDTGIFGKKNKMDLFDEQYAIKLNNNRKLIPKKIKEIVGKNPIKPQDIKYFRKIKEYVWHEDIAGRVMLVPQWLNTGGGWHGIPHAGLNSVFHTKNAKYIKVYNAIKELEKLGVKF